MRNLEGWNRTVIIGRFKKEEGLMEKYCDCKYNEQCESTRQYVQQIIRDGDPTKTVQQCDFYGYIEEKQATPNRPEVPDFDRGKRFA